MPTTDIMPILTSLFERGRAFRETGKGLASENVLQGILQNQAGAAVLKVEELNSLLKGKTKFSTTDPPRYLRLSDIEEGGSRVTPLVYIDGDLLESTAPYLRLQVVLVVHAGNGGAQSRKFALRFETPEYAASGDGKHDYYHSQLCVALQKGHGQNTIELPFDIDWFPTSHPAWPMDAETPAELLTCLILALYGKVQGSEIIRDAGYLVGRDLFVELLSAMRAKFRAQTTRKKPAKARAKKRKVSQRKH